MATQDDGPGEQPLDPVYAALFRPDDEPHPRPADQPPQAAEPVDAPEAAPPAHAEDHAEPEGAAPEPATPPDPPAPAADAAGPRDPAVDTGRLFRSQGVAGHPAAVLAIDHGRRLRTLERSEVAVPPPVAAPAAAPAPGAPDRAGGPNDPAAPAAAAPVTTRTGGRRQISAGAVYLIIFGVTLLVAFADALLLGGELGWPTGVALVASTAYCAFTVRREDDVVVMIVPPLAFLLAALTAGQLFRGPTAGDVLNRAQLVFFTLAFNWYWVIGATLLAVVVVLVRRRR